MDKCVNCIHHEACEHLIDTDREVLDVCEHFKPTLAQGLLMQNKRTVDSLREWQKILGLEDWVVRLNEDVSPNDMQLYGVAGECVWDEIHKAATINIINGKDYGNRILPFDKEKTLVHELLHIKFCMFDNSGNELYDKLLHQLIEDMAKAFVRAKRKEQE